MNGQFKDSYEEYRVQPYFSRAVLVSARASSSTCAATPCSNAVRRRPHPPFGEQRKERGKRFLRVCGEGVRLARLPGRVSSGEHAGEQNQAYFHNPCVVAQLELLAEQHELALNMSGWVCG